MTLVAVAGLIVTVAGLILVDFQDPGEAEDTPRATPIPSITFVLATTTAS